MYIFSKTFKRILIIGFCLTVAVTSLLANVAVAEDAGSTFNKKISSDGLALSKESDIENDPEWIEESNKLKTLRPSPKLTSQDLCMAFWNLYWPWAKKGNLSARAGILADVFPGVSDVPPLGLPGRDYYDFAVRLRDAFILSVNTLGIKPKEKWYESFSFISEYIYDVQSSNEFPALHVVSHEELKIYRKCLLLPPERAKYCAQNAISQGTLPSFEEFSRSIDAAIKNGKLPTCP